jgi:ribonuclease T2
MKRAMLAALAAATVAWGLMPVTPEAQAQRQTQSQGQSGDFDYYALVMSWSPSYCGGEGQGRGDPQCAPNRNYSFVLHGLWPQYARGYPENCRTSFNPFVPRPVIDGVLDIMPSPKLAIHEYRKHGTCSGLEPKAYFDNARIMFNKVKIPPAYQNLDRPLMTNVRDITKAFLAANPGLKPEMMGVACGRPNRMKEIRFCFSKEGEFKTCGSNENQGRLCRSPNIYMPPVRASSGRSSLPSPAPALAPAGERKI